MSTARRVTALVVGLGAVASLSVGGTLGASAASPKSPPSPGDGLGELFPSYYDELTTVDQAIGDLQTSFPDVAGLPFFDAKSLTLSLTYYKGADSSNLSDFLSRASKITVDAPLTFALKPIDYDYGARQAEVADIGLHPEVWQKFFGSAVSGTHLDTDTGIVHVAVENPDAATASTLPDGTPYVADPPVEFDFQVSRWADSPSWYGGDAIDNSAGTVGCTGGFNWKKTSTGELMGSTAEHCYSIGGVSIWYNNGVKLGTRYYYNANVDADLLRGSPTTSDFVPYVWVGVANTSVSRPVVGTQASPIIGTQVALSAAQSGLNIGVIDYTGFYSGSVGPFTLTSFAGCISGDSGGPWLTTHSGSGDVVAHGQHEGIYTYLGYKYCSYIPVSNIGSALGATVLLH